MEKTALNPIESALASLPRQWLDCGILEISNDLTVLHCNDAFSRWLGLPTTDIFGQPLDELLSSIAPEWKPIIDANLGKDGFFQQFDLPMMSVSPPQFYRMEMTRVEGGAVLRLSSTSPDPLVEGQNHDPAIAYREKRIHMLEGLVHSLIGTAPCAFFFQHPDGSVAWANEQIERYTHLSATEWESGRQSLFDLICEPDGQAILNKISKAAEDRQPMDQCFPLCLEQRDGSMKRIYVHEYRTPVVAGGVVVGWNCLWMDATQQNRAEKRVRNIMWRDTLANLAMGVCHDIKNKMAGASMVAEMLPERIANNEPTHTDLVMLGRSIDDASSLAKRIMEISNEKAGIQETIEVTSFLRELLSLFHKSLSGRCSVDQEFLEQPINVHVDKVEIRRAVSNLILNAADASQPGSRIKVSARTCETFDPGMAMAGTPPDGPAVAISVTDTGRGVPKDHLAQLFEPFFTTKAVGKGTGLGLRIVSDIATQHHGAVTVESIEGQGATFTLWLPLASGNEAFKEEAGSSDQQGYILVAGTDDAQINSISQFLRGRGFKVSTALSPREAVATLKHGEKTVSCLYLLVNSPNPSVVELVTLARSLEKPPLVVFQTMGFDADDLPVVFSSLADRVFPHDTQRCEITEFLDEHLR